MRISSVGTAYPKYRYSQTQIAEALTQRWQHKLEEPRLISRIHSHCGVDFRNFVLPLDTYPTLVGFGQTNSAWIAGAVELGETAITRALTRAGIAPEDISAIFFASVTGIASPTIDARLINRLPFPVTVKRTPIFGLGCVAGAAGIARAADYVRAFPKEIALLLSVELCSLTWQDDDQSIANIISTGLFADGAAAVVIAGAESKLAPPTGPQIIATRSTFYRNTERIMGWDVVDNGFRIVLSPDVPRIVNENFLSDVQAFLADQNLTQADIASYIFHSGGAPRSSKPWKSPSASPRTLSPRRGNLFARSATSPLLLSSPSSRTTSPSTPATRALTAFWRQWDPLFVPNSSY